MADFRTMVVGADPVAVVQVVAGARRQKRRLEEREVDEVHDERTVDIG